MSPACAHAGAWVAPKGGQSIFNAVVSERNDAAVYESSTYIETPINDRWSVVAVPWGEYDQSNLEEPSRGETTFGVKRALIRDERGAMAIQVSALWVTNPQEGCSEGGVEARWLGGLNLPRRAFVNLELAGRALDGGCGGGRADLTYGLQPNDHWLVMGQVFADAPLDGEETFKAQFSLVRFVRDGRLGVQLGARVRLDGEAPEPALVLGVWRRPGD